MPYIRRLPSKKWQATVRLPDGRRRTFTHSLREVVKEWAIDQEKQLRRGSWRDPKAGRITVGEWCERWRAARVVEASTRRTDEAWLRRYVLPQWEDWSLDAVTTMEVQWWVRKLVDDGLAPATATRAFHLLSSMLEAAFVDRLVEVNPCQHVQLPRVERRPDRFLTHDEVDAIAGKLTEPWSTVVLTGAWLGLRWGEIAGLHARRVDFLRGRVSVVDVLTPDGLREYPKSKRSRRELPVPPFLVERMSRLLEGRGRDELVFARKDGSPVVYQTYYWWWKRALDEAGVAYCNPHVLRHTAASWLVMAGVDLLRVQAFMGHETYATTTRYAHLAPSAMEAVETAWRAMGETQGPRVERLPGS